MIMPMIMTTIKRNNNSREESKDHAAERTKREPHQGGDVNNVHAKASTK